MYNNKWKKGNRCNNPIFRVVNETPQVLNVSSPSSHVNTFSIHKAIFVLSIDIKYRTILLRMHLHYFRLVISRIGRPSSHSSRQNHMQCNCVDRIHHFCLSMIASNIFDLCRHKTCVFSIFPSILYLMSFNAYSPKQLSYLEHLAKQILNLRNISFDYDSAQLETRDERKYYIILYLKAYIKRKLVEAIKKPHYLFII